MRRDGNKRTRNAFELMLKCGLLKPKIKRWDAALKPASIVVTR